jgi:TorA maturation chaperone TorD
MPAAKHSGWEADFAALSQQVSSLESDYRDIKIAVVNLDKKIDDSFARLSMKIDSRNVTPWASIWTALGVLLAGMTTVGYLALQPMQTSISQLHYGLEKEISKRNDEDHQLLTKLDKTRSDVDQLLGVFKILKPVQ